MITSLLAAVTVLALPQTGPGSTARERAIWSYAQGRLEQQVDVWFNDGEFPKVIQALRYENHLYPADYEVATNLGWMQENIEDYVSAEATYTRYVRQNPKEVDAALPLAQMHFMKRQYDKVIPILEPTIKRTPPPHPNVWRILAHSYERTGKLQDSKRVWEKYLKLAPNDLTAKANLKRVLGKINGS